MLLRSLTLLLVQRLSVELFTALLRVKDADELCKCISYVCMSAVISDACSFAVVVHY
jgi:hypothetical protein